MADGCGVRLRKTLESDAAVAARKIAMRPSSGTSSFSSPAKMIATPTIATIAAATLLATRRSTRIPAAMSAVESGTVAYSTAAIPLGTTRSPQ